MKTIRDVDVKDKTVLVRVDYNVPLADGKVASDLRILASLETIKYLQEHGAKIVLISHLGRPEGVDAKFSLAPVAEVLAGLIPKVRFVPDLTGESVVKNTAEMKPGEVILLENLRFYPGEKANSDEFAQAIVDATHAEIFVQDGFAVVHRAHASTDAIAKILPAYAGFLVEKEVENLSKAVENPEKPVVLVIGGSKVEDKQPLIDKFLTVADKILVGGKIAADGYKAQSDKIYVAEDFDTDESGAKLDIGPVSAAKFAEAIADAKTVIWNGVLGKVEDPAYDASSTIVATVMGEKRDGLTVVCGGDTTGFVEGLQKTHPALEYSLVSTGGGAALEYLLGRALPGLVPLE